MTLVWVALGGAVGAVLRWGLTALNARWPAGTLIANVGGSFLLGVLVTTVDDPALLAGVGVGILGGLTTFSTFAVEAATRQPRPAAAYVAVSLLSGVGAAMLGVTLGGAAGV